MSHDLFEDRLRTELRGAADAQAPDFLDIDPAVVLGTGRRVVRRRRMAVAGGTLAALAVLGAGSWAVLDGSTDRSAPEVPATRSAGPDVAPDVVSTTLPAGNGGPVTVYTVRLERSTGRVTVASTSPDGATKDLGDIGRVPTDRPGAVYATVSHDPFVAVGVLPSDAEQLMTRFGTADLGGVSTEEGPLRTTSWKAFLVHSDKSPAGAELTGLDWASGGRVFDASGNALPAARIGDRTVYVDAAAGELGSVEPDGSARGPLTTATDEGALPRLWTAVTPSGTQTRSTVTLLLPIGAQDVQVGATAGSTVRSTDTAPLLGGSALAVVAVVEGPDARHPDVASVTWTVDGKRTTWRDGGAVVVPGGSGGPDQRLVVETVSDASGTRVVVSVEEAGRLDLADVLSLADAGKAGVARAGDGAGSTRALALVPGRPQAVTATGSPTAAFAPSRQGWASLAVPGTSMSLVGVRVTGDLEVSRWTSLRWTEGGGATHELPVTR